MQGIKSVFSICLLLGLFCLPGNAVAATCSVSTTSVNFGTYWGDVAISSTGTVTVSCNIATTTVVQLNAGQNAGRTFFRVRKMASGANKIKYNLYTDASHTRVWKDGIGGTYSVTGSNLTIYGLMPAGQAVSPGTYSDTVLVTITW